MRLLLPSFLFLVAILVFIISIKHLYQDSDKLIFDSSTNIFYALYETTESFLLVGHCCLSELLTLFQLSSDRGCNMSIFIDFEHCVTCPHRNPPHWVLQRCP